MQGGPVAPLQSQSADLTFSAREVPIAARHAGTARVNLRASDLRSRKPRPVKIPLRGP
jgi:hypothetical protein